MEAHGMQSASYPHHCGASAGMRFPTDSYKHLPMDPSRATQTPGSNLILSPASVSGPLLSLSSPHSAKEAEPMPSSKPNSGLGTS